MRELLHDVRKLKFYDVCEQKLNRTAHALAKYVPRH
jgi:hypothetical protein